MSVYEVSMRKSQKTMVVVPEARLAYLNVWEPKKLMNGTKKYSAEIIFPKTETELLKKIDKAMNAAIVEYRSRIPSGTGGEFISPVKDGDMERPNNPEYEGMCYMWASSMNPPGIVDAKIKPIVNRAEVYSGIYAKVSVSFYVYNKTNREGNPAIGIACCLRNIMKLRDAKSLGKRDTPEDDFAEDME